MAGGDSFCRCADFRPCPIHDENVARPHGRDTADELAMLRTENERLRALLVRAYNEGKARLEGDETGEDETLLADIRAALKVTP